MEMPVVDGGSAANTPRSGRSSATCWATARSSLVGVVKVAGTGLRSPEVARRLGIDGADVYRLLFAGELEGGPGADGLVYMSEASVQAYLGRHGFGNVSNNLSNEPRRTGPDDVGRARPEHDF